MTATRPAFRKPWTDGARGYHEADNLDALREGLKRKRARLTVLVRTESIRHLKCGICGRGVADKYLLNSGTSEQKWHRDTSGWTFVDCNPKTKTAVAKHYYCAWTSLMQKVLDLGRVISL